MPNKSNRWETKACHPQRCIDRLHGFAMPYNCFAPLPVKGVTPISHHLTRQATQKLCLSQLCQSPERIFDRSKFDVASKPHVHVRVPPSTGQPEMGFNVPPTYPGPLTKGVQPLHLRCLACAVRSPGSPALVRPQSLASWLSSRLRAGPQRQHCSKQGCRLTRAKKATAGLTSARTVPGDA